MKNLKDFLAEEDAMGTVEVVLITAILVGIGIMFKEKAGQFAFDLLEKLKADKIKVDDIMG